MPNGRHWSWLTSRWEYDTPPLNPSDEPQPEEPTADIDAYFNDPTNAPQPPDHIQAQGEPATTLRDVSYTYSSGGTDRYIPVTQPSYQQVVVNGQTYQMPYDSAPPNRVNRNGPTRWDLPAPVAFVPTIEIDWERKIVKISKDGQQTQASAIMGATRMVITPEHINPASPEQLNWTVEEFRI